MIISLFNLIHILGSFFSSDSVYNNDFLSQKEERIVMEETLFCNRKNFFSNFFKSEEESQKWLSFIENNSIQVNKRLAILLQKRTDIPLEVSMIIIDFLPNLLNIENEDGKTLLDCVVENSLYLKMKQIGATHSIEVVEKKLLSLKVSLSEIDCSFPYQHALEGNFAHVWLAIQHPNMKYIKLPDSVIFDLKSPYKVTNWLLDAYYVQCSPKGLSDDILGTI